MNLEQNFPQISGPFLSGSGAPSEEWLAFFRALWNRTGGAPGASTDDAALLAALNGVGHAEDAIARTEAQAAALLALTRGQNKRDLSEAELFALAQTRAPAAQQPDLTALSLFRPRQPADLTEAKLFALSLFQSRKVTATSTTSGGSWFPLTNGVEPPAFVSDGAGVPIAVAYNP